MSSELIGMQILSDCVLCPHECHSDRLNSCKGVCKSGSGINVGSICLHKGEEPVLTGETGICNVFFTRCNLRCIYCQNYQISSTKNDIFSHNLSIEEIVDCIITILDTGCNLLGFVSPSHYIPQMTAIVNKLNSAGRKPVIVMNTNAYDKVDVLRKVEGLIDVYLPDFKYMDQKIAREYSGAGNYPEVATSAIKEMYRQKGSNLFLDDNGLAESGLVIRHLILPGHTDNSIDVLRRIADTIGVSVHISLMSQYYPTDNVKDHPCLGRKLTFEEYNIVVEEMERLGFYRGWTQEPESQSHYQPDFLQSHPFEF